MSGPAPKLVYLVTNFANPSGATLSLERRLRLLRWAVRRNVLLVEDDPYGELRIRGEAIAPLLALARDIPGAAEHCIYISSLSKILSPGMRLGFILAPPAIRDALIRAKQAMDLHTSSFAQEIVARYLQTDRLSQRMPMLRAIYRERNDALAQALTRTFGDHLQFNRPDGGMFLWARFTDGTDTMRLLAAARQQGVIFVPGSAFFPALDAGRPGAEKPDVDPNAATLRLSFATLTPSQLQQAVQRLATAHTSLR
jgi:DNA-binding transcriptional MocR family regulator